METVKGIRTHEEDLKMIQTVTPTSLNETTPPPKGALVELPAADAESAIADQAEGSKLPAS
jgi:hypothetical protein